MSLCVITVGQCIQFYQLLVRMKTFKINRINLSPQMFQVQDENEHILQPKMITPYLKRFNLNNQRYIKIATFNHTKSKKYSIRSQLPPNSPFTPKINPQQQMRRIEQTSKLGKYSTQLQEEPSSLSKSQLTTSETNKTYYRPKIYEIMHRNKTEQDQTNFTSNLIWKKWQDQHYHPKDTNSKLKGKESKDIDVPRMARQRYFPVRNNILYKSIKDRNPLSKYKNSILRSYRVKTIQLMGPQESNKTVTKFKTTLPYFIDLANDDNLKEIHLQDLRKIQTEQYQIRHRKTLSNQPYSTFYNNRLASKISQKAQEFQPCPWDYQQKQEQNYNRDDILQF